LYHPFSDEIPKVRARPASDAVNEGVAVARGLHAIERAAKPANRFQLVAQLRRALELQAGRGGLHLALERWQELGVRPCQESAGGTCPVTVAARRARPDAGPQTRADLETQTSGGAH